MVNGVCGSRPGTGFGDQDLPPQRGDGQIDAGPRADLGRPRAGSADDGVRVDRSEVGPHGHDAAVADVDPRGCAVRQQGGSGPSSGRRVAEDDRLRSAVSVGRRVRPGEQSLVGHERRQATGLLDADHAARDAEVVLQGDVGLEGRHGLRCAQEEQVADLVQVDLLTEQRGEIAEGLQTARSERDVHRIGELRPDAAGSLGRRARPQSASVHQDDVAHSPPGQVVGRAEPDHPAADDDDGGGGRDLAPGSGHHDPQRAGALERAAIVGATDLQHNRCSVARSL
jgi:hypothetical protein